MYIIEKGAIMGNYKKDIKEVYKYRNEYAKQNYDRCIFQVKKGKKELIVNHAKEQGYNGLTDYVISLIEKDMNVKLN